MTLSNTMAILPEIIIAIAALSVMLCDIFLGKKIQSISYIVSQFFLISASCCTIKETITPICMVSGGGTLTHNFIFNMHQCIFLIGFLVFLYGKDYIKDHVLPAGEFYVLSLLSILGALVLISSYSLLTIYIGLELLSLPLYALLAIRSEFLRSSEAAVKFFIMGAITSGFLLYGMSLIYGITGSINILDISYYLTNKNLAHSNLVLIAMLLMLTTASFKLGVVPFHMWVPDVYEGSPKVVIAFISSISKLATFAMLFNILIIIMPAQDYAWKPVLIILGVLSIFLGNVLALTQINIKRLLGYSAIVHTGFIFLGLVLSPTSFSIEIVLYYLIIYSLMVTAVFGCLILLSLKGNNIEVLSDISGLNSRNPWLSFLILMIMFSMAGIPPFAGFIAKFFIIMGLVNQESYVLAVYALIMSVIASFYYIRVVKMMYFDLPFSRTTIYINKKNLLVLSINCLLILILGMFPGLLINLIRPVFFLP